MLPILLSLLAASSAAQPTKRQDGKPVFMPLKYPYNGYPKVYADIYLGTPEQTPIETVVDLGSSDYWVYGPNSTIYYGSPYLGVEGHCRETPEPSYNPFASSTALGFLNKTRGYAYGGNGKMIESHYSVNETLSFSADDSYPHLVNTQVAITNKTIIKVRADECDGTTYDSSILGLSAPRAGSGPSFRQNLLDGGSIASSTLAMWFDAAPAGVRDDYRGTLLLGALPKGKYSGELVQVPRRQPEGSIGYYVDTPAWSAAGRVVKPFRGFDNSTVDECLIDSGSGQDYLPIDEDDFLDAVGGVVMFNGYPAWNGSCESIPADKSVAITFKAVAEGQSVTVDMPLRNWARGNTDFWNNTQVCGLSMSLSNVGSCTLGSPFSSAVFLAVNDELNQIALAQGGVSTGAEDGYEGLGEVEVIPKGQGLP
ncbi:peptidase a1 protein [Diplodia corticola]|uniref:Peptidase a1 protein n=1 Tax=Diplodia corticola TaxID=236234 RepID=A0A1J9RQM9_9PEZI|nr:peptidase a1 protein [Diplodia corticola]OJD30751.1 peptidase a1 protein [Diplodia corticola]